MVLKSPGLLMDAQYPMLGAKPLLTMPKYALEQIPKAVLKDFCLKHDLAVGCSGKREGDAIKKDYVDSIQEYVSNLARAREKTWHY